MISPVMKLAKSEARKRIGPAISSAVAGRPSGIAAAAIERLRAGGADEASLRSDALRAVVPEPLQVTEKEFRENLEKDRLSRR